MQEYSQLPAVAMATRMERVATIFNIFGPFYGLGIPGFFDFVSEGETTNLTWQICWWDSVSLWICLRARSITLTKESKKGSSWVKKAIVRLIACVHKLHFTTCLRVFCAEFDVTLALSLFTHKRKIETFLLFYRPVIGAISRGDTGDMSPVAKTLQGTANVFVPWTNLGETVKFAVNA